MIDMNFIVESVDRTDRSRRVYSKGPGFLGVFGLPKANRQPHPVYHQGYPRAVAWWYQGLLLRLFDGRRWADDVLRLAADLDYSPPHDLLYDSEGHAAYFQAIEDGVKEVTPDLADAVEPFAARHGLVHIPWGRGWLYDKLRFGSRSGNTKVPLRMRVWGPPRPKKSVELGNTRQNPSEDALLLYLDLTGVWRNEEAQALVRPVICTCGNEAEDNHVNHDGGCAIGPKGYWSNALRKRLERIKASLDIHRERGRPKGHSEWDRDEVFLVLSEYMEYQYQS